MHYVVNRISIYCKIQFTKTVYVQSVFKQMLNASWSMGNNVSVFQFSRARTSKNRDGRVLENKMGMLKIRYSNKLINFCVRLIYSRCKLIRLIIGGGMGNLNRSALLTINPSLYRHNMSDVSFCTQLLERFVPKTYAFAIEILRCKNKGPFKNLQTKIKCVDMRQKKTYTYCTYCIVI